MRWGICSAGLIATDFCNALQCLDPSEHKIIAVVSKSLEKSKKFAEEFEIPNVYDSYEEFAKNPNIDLVYVSSVNRFHHPLSVIMLNNGKPVLCEKAYGKNTKETKDIIELAKSKKIFFMEAMWSNFFPAYKHIKQEIDSGTIGKIRYLDVAFLVDIFSKEDISQGHVGGGGLLEIGVYTIWLANFIFRQKPETITAFGTIAGTGTDLSANIILTYKDGARASLSFNTTLAGRTDAYIYGTEGKIYIHPPFWCTDKIAVNGEEREFPLPKSDAKYTYVHSCGLAYEAEDVRQYFEKGHLECPVHTHADTLLLINIIDEVRRQLEETQQKN